MGVYNWITSLTGAWGPALLAMYQANALWINGIVCVYGFVLVLSWQNTERIGDMLVSQILEQGSRMAKNRQGASRLVRLRDFNLAWDEAVQQARFPWVAAPGQFVPRPRRLDNVRAIISAKYLRRKSAGRLAKLGLEIKD
jgi:hypothetical protein